ncbi:hypothetical protein [Pseudoduganella violaceinigra]|uniref:hypothetical protein n=1 Tax=Pseudoduganella violaceinigra TaxID=246602 RepID=UPI00055732D9|nr:hypothetical protein [Pseudoduganella violaceinigra]
MSVRKSLLFGAIGFCLTNWAIATERAEYAFRWEVAKGGPSSIRQVAKTLNVQEEKPERFEVRYFDVGTCNAVPSGYTIIGRERSLGGEKPDATVKVRGPDPATSELLDWKCPLDESEKSKREVDIGFRGLDEVKRSFSVSCTLKKSGLKASLPAGYSAAAKACSNKMERAEAESEGLKIKIEKWKLPKKRVAIEVSMVGDDTNVDFEKFKTKVVKPLMDQKAVPLKESKTELGGDC